MVAAPKPLIVQATALIVAAASLLRPTARSPSLIATAALKVLVLSALVRLLVVKEGFASPASLPPPPPPQPASASVAAVSKTSIG